MERLSTQRQGGGLTPSSYPGRALLLTAEERLADLAPDPARGWGELIAELDVRGVPGDHFSMVAEPHVETLARVLYEMGGKGKRH